MSAYENLNLVWASALFDELRRGGVQDVVVCPGSRSGPLAIAASRNSELKTWSVIDERSAAFFALGLAKQTARPTALVCTSGTAAAHFFPAVIEASLSRLPLVILSADRPWELHGFGAPQTIEQGALFGRYVRSFVELAAPEANAKALLHLRSVMARAVNVATVQCGPVQVNAAFRDPLDVSRDEHPTDVLKSLDSSVAARFIGGHVRVDVAALDEVFAALAPLGRGLIVCGPRRPDEAFGTAVHALGRAWGVPVLAEATSSARFGASGAIAHYDALVRNAAFAQTMRPEFVLRFGGGLTSKALQSWLDASQAVTIGFSEGGDPIDPNHRARFVLTADEVEACQALAAKSKNADPSYAEAFHCADELARKALLQAAGEDLSEPTVARELVGQLPPGASLFVSSSMPIRDLDAFAVPSGAPLRVFANRGANGIDGIVSTTAGIAARANRPSAVLTGDLALLHDLSGLVTARRLGVSMAVVVVNNDGGGIFHFLPVSKAGASFEELFATPHGIDLAQVAAMAGARHWQPRSISEYRGALRDSLEGGLHLIEVRTDRSANVTEHRRLFEAVAKMLEATPWR
jgi:2-succinyl-5-enolpyruvyl-6-hydroxy-3-cyclohexene-1-carboxylate synthase